MSAKAVPATAGRSAVGGSRGFFRRFTPRTLVMIGVGVLLVAGSVAGTLSLRSSNKSLSLSNYQSVLASAHASGAASGATITVTGSGAVEGTPDTASFSIGVDTTESTAAAALDQNNTQVANLEQSLEQSGVPAKDIQTSELDLYANTDNSGAVTGFSADDDLNVTITGLSGLGSALDAAVHAAGNGATLGGISFSISNQSTLLATARAQAMQAARTEASQIAAGGGLVLGPIVKITDQENVGQNILYESPEAFAASRSSVPVQAGQQQITVDVTVVYQLVAS
ncbi:MAG: SIMPL domain-containing protein [Acidimicrobiales bacterium]